MNNRSSKILFLFVGCLVLLAACQGSRPQSKPLQTAGADATAEYQAAGDGALGVQSEIVAAGDLAGNGTTQILAIQGEAAGNPPAERKIWRAAVLEKRTDRWQELLLVDEHLKNQSGYLGATPPEGVAEWLLRVERGASQMTLYFTPLSKGKSSRQPIAVRWNPRVKRYQAMNAAGKTFLGDRVTLDPVKMDLRRSKQ